MQDSNSVTENDSINGNGSGGESESSFGSRNSNGSSKIGKTTDLKASWSDQEESALLEALRKYKWGEWEAIQTEIGTKTVSQVKSKISNLKAQQLGPKASQVKRDIVAIISEKKSFETTSKRKKSLDSKKLSDVEKGEENKLKSKRRPAIAAKSPTKSPIKKRSYNRGKITKKASGIVAVNSGEDVSILSSSSSEKESINIMSSSSSSQSLPSLSSAKSKSSSQRSSVKSRRLSSKKSDSSSNESLLSFSSVESKISDTDVPDWIKESCPAIFASKALLNPLLTYKKLKAKMMLVLAENPEATASDLKNHKSLQLTSMKALIQMLDIIKQESADKSINNTIKKGRSSKKTSEKDLIAEDYELLKKMSSTSSGRKRKIRSEEGDWIDPNEIEGRVISHEPAAPIKEKRKRKYVRKEFFSEDGVLSSTEDPFRLIYLNDFGKDKGSEDIKAPFRVQICRSVLLMMDLHSHLHSSEIIGLLGGAFIKGELDDGSDSILRIDYGYPCLTAHSTGTQVDVDPLSEMEAGEYFETKNVRMSGWYHSHPNFEPNPSLRDLETQTMYQNLFKNSLPGSDAEPFIGVIVNPYLALTESSSHVECFYVLPNSEIPSQERLPYRLPIEAVAFNPDRFPQLVDSMREIVLRAQESDDRLDMQKNAEPGIKRIDKLFNSLKFHGNLTEEQFQQIQSLFDQKQPQESE